MLTINQYEHSLIVGILPQLCYADGITAALLTINLSTHSSHAAIPYGIFVLAQYPHKPLHNTDQIAPFDTQKQGYSIHVAPLNNLGRNHFA